MDRQRFLPWTLALFIVAPIAGALADRVGNRWLVSIGLTLQGVGLAWVALNVADDRPYSWSIAAPIVSGIGTCMALPSGQNAVMNAVPASRLGQASACSTPDVSSAGCSAWPRPTTATTIDRVPVLVDANAG